VQLSIFLIDLLVGTYRLSSHARLEAFVICLLNMLAEYAQHSCYILLHKSKTLNALTPWLQLLYEIVATTNS